MRSSVRSRLAPPGLCLDEGASLAVRAVRKRKRFAGAREGRPACFVRHRKEVILPARAGVPFRRDTSGGELQNVTVPDRQSR